MHQLPVRQRSLQLMAAVKHVFTFQKDQAKLLDFRPPRSGTRCSKFTPTIPVGSTSYKDIYLAIAGTSTTNGAAHISHQYYSLRKYVCIHFYFCFYSSWGTMDLQGQPHDRIKNSPMLCLAIIMLSLCP